jgi:chorismate synthase
MVKNMGDNSFGDIFSVTSFGESHGKVIGAIIDGIPAGLKINQEFIQKELNMRKPGQSSLSTQRMEPDVFEILSGVFNDFTTGAPLCIIVKNRAFDSTNYEQNKHKLRPSHSDYSALKKYGGYADYRGSGRFSGRITVSYVLAGAFAKQILQLYDVHIFAYTKSIGPVNDDQKYDLDSYKEIFAKREKSPVRTIDSTLSKKMEKHVSEVSNSCDSIGGKIKCIISNFPPGIGGPVFNRIESNISKAIFSIPSIKGIEFGKGFKATEMRGSENNDPWILSNKTIVTSKNDAGGILGGISTGMPIEFTVAVKPTPSIGIPQETVNIETMEEDTIEIKGKHDPCIVPRAVIVVEAVTAIVLVDYLLKEGKIPLVLNTVESK